MVRSVLNKYLVTYLVTYLKRTYFKYIYMIRKDHICLHLVRSVDDFLWGGIQYIRFWLSLLQWKYTWTTCIDFVRTCSCESGILFTHLWQHFCGINVEYALEEMTREIPRSRHICLISHKPSNLMKNIYLCNQFFMSIALFQHILKLIKNTIYGLED